MFEGFTTTEIETSGARIHLRHGGDGPPILLLHGNPLTHVSWHKIAPRLAERFHVVAADLRGYGDSVGPDDAGENHINRIVNLADPEHLFPAPLGLSGAAC